MPAQPLSASRRVASPGSRGSGSSALDALENAYARRGERPGGGFTVGYVGADVPVELLTAAGVTALRLTGDPDGDSTQGDLYLGTGVDPMARSILSRLLGGAFGDLDRVVVSHDCEASLRLFYALRELRRVEPGAGVPEPYLVDIRHLPHRTTARYNRRRIGEFAARLTAWTGRPHLPAGVGMQDERSRFDMAGPDEGRRASAVTVPGGRSQFETADAMVRPDEDRRAASAVTVRGGRGWVDVAGAVAAHDERRRLLTAVAGLRRAVPARLTGRQFLAVVNAPLPPAEHVALLKELLAEADRLPAHHGRRVFLTGGDHDTPHVYEAIEADGHVIVGEDHSFGDPSFERLVGAGDLDALAEYYHEGGPYAPAATTADRAARTATAARRCHAEVLVGYARTGDDAPAWDFPEQRAALGLPAVLLDRQAYGRADLKELRCL